MAFAPPDRVVGNSQYGGQFSAPSATTPTPPPSNPGGGGTYTTAIPGIDVYGQADAMAHQAYAAALARINQQRGNIVHQQGYTAQIDPATGMITNLAVDVHNPYGALQQLLGTEANQDEGASEQAQQRGIMGGLANKASTSLKYQHGADSAALGSNFDTSLNGLQTQQDDAYQQMQNTLWEAMLAQAQLAIQNQNYNPYDPGSSGSSGSDGSNTTKTDATKQAAIRAASAFTGSTSKKNADKRVNGGKI